jgi:hypothetical protein
MMSSKQIKEGKCMEDNEICIHLHTFFGFSPSLKKDVDIYDCTSEEDLACGCCRKMRKKNNRLDHYYTGDVRAND